MKRISSLLALQFLHQPDANSAAEGNRTGITPHASADGLYRQSGRELSLPAANLKLESKLAIMEQYVGKKVIDAVVVGPKADVSAVNNRIVIQEVLEASDIPYRHDRQLLHNALEKALQALG